MSAKARRSPWTASTFVLFLAAFCAQPGWPDITLNFLDSQSKPVPGVSCALNGSAPAVSDAAGTLILKTGTSIFRSGRRADGGFLLSQIPLSSGDEAALTVADIRGRTVLSRRISLGKRVEFSRKNKGVYFVSVSSRAFSARERFVNLGEGLIFESVPFRADPSGSLAKSSPSAAANASIICSKAGFSTQVYQIPDGSTVTLDFSKPTMVPLYDNATPLDPETIVETPTAIITRFADRARDRHAREDEFHLYDHYLSHYWDDRTAEIEIIDEVAKGGKKIRINVITQWKLGAPEFRAFYRGIGTVAEYHSNISLTRDPNDVLKYNTELTTNSKENRDIKIGDRVEIEVSQFLDAPPEGRANYYGTAVLYIAGQGGLVPWEAHGIFGDGATEREDSYPIAAKGWLGGRTTLPYQYSNEPNFHFIQMAPNLAPQNGQVFVWGRRVHHTNFVTGAHDEPDNPIWTEMTGKAGTHYVNNSCVACHVRNGRALPPATGEALSQYVVKVGDADGKPHPQMGRVLQPQSTGGSSEGSVAISGWTESNGLRSPKYAFSGGAAPAQFSARISPPLVGLGLLEAVPETAILDLADPDDANGDGISGRVHIVADLQTGVPRLGRFGWKAGKARVSHQVAGAFNTDMGVMTSILPSPDCGSAQTNCGASGSEISDKNLQNLIDYIGLLGVSARRDLADPAALQGEALFTSAGCAACHIPTLTTGDRHPKAELRKQTIHPFTDLLIHDMGPGLADNLAEEGAAGSEWRTAPLWNIGLTARVSDGEGYLHDGRARTLNEAILWHGGEGAKAAEKFKAMSSADAGALIKFLKSL